MTLGFREVFDYEAGKLDWLGAGLPRDGDAAGKLTVGDVARPGLPTAHLGDPADAVLEKMAEGDWPQAVVINQLGVILGRLRRSRLQESPAALVDVLIEEGPSTSRPNEDLAETVKGLVEGDVHYLLVSNPDGNPLGLLFMDEATKRLTSP